MEFLLGLAIIVIILLILGFGPDVIILGAVILLGALTALTEIFFLYCDVRLIFSKRRSAVFTRIAKHGKAKYESAFYMTEAGELPNIFPCEVIMRNRLYDPEKTVKVHIDAGKRFVYDRNALLTILFGTLLGALLCFLIAAGLFLLYGGRP